MTTKYPTLATVLGSTLDELQQLDRTLPEPQTDVERTIRRRVRVQIAKLEDDRRRARREAIERFESIFRKAEDRVGKARSR